MEFILVHSAPGGTDRIPPRPASAPFGWQVVRYLGDLRLSWTPPFSSAAGHCHESASGVALLAGDPVPSNDERMEGQLARCLANLLADATPAAACASVTSLLEDFYGHFAMVLAPSHGRYAVFAGDHLGIRPLYHALTPAGTFVATRLGLLAATLPSPPHPDFLGVLQWGQFDTIYGARTVFEGVTRNRAAEIWVTRGSAETYRTTYLDWSTPSLGPVDLELRTAARGVHAAFKAAVRRRCRPSATDLAFLSGGMDSRMLVHTLLAEGRRVQTVSFAPPDSQDRDFAEQFARVAGLAHRAMPRPAHRRVDWGGLMRSAIEQALRDGWLAGRPEAVWSGDGGSVGMGGVNLSTSLIGAFASGSPGHVAECTARVSLPRFSISRGRRETIRRALQDEVATEAAPLFGLDPERAARTFLMLHDQRRHLDFYHELLPNHGVPYRLPFYDRELLLLLAALPANQLRSHALYTEIFRQIGHPVASIPYQTYPGHLPALALAPTGQRYQWRAPGTGWRQAADRRAQVRAGCKALRAKPRDRGGISRVVAAIAVVLHSSGLRNQSSLLDLLSDLQLASAMTKPGWKP